MDDLISRQAAIDVLDVLCQEHRYKIPGKRETYSQYNEAWQDALDRAEGAIFNLPSAQPERTQERTETHACDLIDRQAAIAHAVPLNLFGREVMMVSVSELENLPSAQPEQRYSKEELMVFQHDISLSLLSKRSSQHWEYDEGTATEIKFLERLYEKVGADMRGGENDGCSQVFKREESDV